MNNHTNLIICTDETDVQPVEQARFFSLQEANFLWSPEALVYTDFLDKLVFNIARRPRRLITHLQRIYYCFHTNLNEQLFAAIVDFLIVLNKRGQAISWRVLIGAKSQLSSDQFQLLKGYLKGDYGDINLLPGNQYSIFSKGLLGLNKMVQQIEQQREESGYDPLELARDHIEYSQLEEAKQVLEKAVLEQPARSELHHELLALYQSTRDSTGFNQMLTELTQSGFTITDEWMQLNDYFKGRNNDG